MPALLTTPRATTAPTFSTPDSPGGATSTSPQLNPLDGIPMPPTPIPQTDLAEALRRSQYLLYMRLWALLSMFSTDPDTHITHTDYSVISRCLNYHRPKRGQPVTATYTSIEDAVLYIIARRLARYERERMSPYDPMPTLIARMNSRLLSITTRRGYPSESNPNVNSFIRAAANDVVLAIYERATTAALNQGLPAPKPLEPREDDDFGLSLDNPATASQQIPSEAPRRTKYLRHQPHNPRPQHHPDPFLSQSKHTGDRPSRDPRCAANRPAPTPAPAPEPSLQPAA